MNRELATGSCIIYSSELVIERAEEGSREANWESAGGAWDKGGWI
jgi:hypothetical protein